jgi:hypothetical protein
VKVVGDWLWCNDMTGSRLELGLGCSNTFVMETRGKMDNIAGGGGSPMPGMVHLSWC